jgi:uroporphyrinogen decarboxylase
MYQARSRGEFFWFTGMEAFEIVKEILGHENICLAALDDPTWLREVFDTETEMVIRILDHYEANGIEFDGGWIYGDIAFNHGPFISPAHYRDIVKPGHARIVDWFKHRGKPVIYHTDGDFRPLIPDFLDLGIDCFQPLEAKANMDVRQLKREIGDRVTFMGNIDIMVLITNDPDLVEAEVAAKIPLAMKGGGYIYHSDHSIPPGVTWATYQHLMRLVDRYGSYG